MYGAVDFLIVQYKCLYEWGVRVRRGSEYVMLIYVQLGPHPPYAMFTLQTSFNPLLLGGGGLRSPGIIFKESIRPAYAGVLVRQPFLFTGGVYYALYVALLIS